ncbi:MAG: dihydroorotate dehydrogenase [Spirochaetota bacterium]
MNPLTTEILGIHLSNPLVLPAGLMDVSYGSMLYAAENGAGIVTMKSLTLTPRPGHPGPVVHEADGVLLNSMGLCNPGIDAGLEEITQFKMRCDTVPVIASVFATESDDFVTLAETVNSSDADFIELNLSCPNVSAEFGVPIAASKESVREMVSAVAAVSSKPVLAKLSPNTYNVPEIASAAEAGGADALVLINTLGPGMAIDIHAERKVLSASFGGLSGPAIKPVAVKLIYQCRQAVSIPIIGMGGVTCGADAVELIMAGASLVGVGSAIYYRGIDVFKKIGAEIMHYCESKGLASVRDIRTIE